ncbi:MAG: hypothetical protein JXR91_03855 [Deltaproteobacteria bacterium]|nr:hypothetical protein [Deltaproteobacteria bacterium]
MQLVLLGAALTLMLVACGGSGSEDVPGPVVDTDNVEWICEGYTIYDVDYDFNSTTQTQEWEWADTRGMGLFEVCATSMGDAMNQCVKKCHDFHDAGYVVPPPSASEFEDCITTSVVIHPVGTLS